MDIMQYIEPALLVLVPVLNILGKIIKDTEYIKDKYIPSMLGAVGVALAIIWVLATATLSTGQDWLLAAFIAVVQGVLVTGVAVYFNQLWKQANKWE